MTINDWAAFKAQYSTALTGGRVGNKRALDPQTREAWLIEMGLEYDKEQLEAYKRDYEMVNGTVRKKVKHGQSS